MTNAGVTPSRPWQPCTRIALTSGSVRNSYPPRGRGARPAQVPPRKTPAPLSAEPREREVPRSRPRVLRAAGGGFGRPPFTRYLSEQRQRLAHRDPHAPGERHRDRSPAAISKLLAAGRRLRGRRLRSCGMLVHPRARRRAVRRSCDGPATGRTNALQINPPSNIAASTYIVMLYAWSGGTPRASWNSRM